MPSYTAVVSLAAVGLYFGFALRVAIAHGRYGVTLPATSGHPDFDRIARIHVNTLEWMPTFMIPLWLAAVFFSDIAAASLGLLWIAGRVWYSIGYGRSVSGRLPGFFVQSSACMLLFAAAALGVFRHIGG